MITFNIVEGITTSEQKKNIFDWCKDHVENFGAIPMEYAEWNDDKGEDVILNYDQMLSGLSQDQINELDKLIDLHEQD